VAILSVAAACGGAVAAEWDHAHLLAPDTAEAAAWYAKHFGGKVTKAGPFDAVLFGNCLVKFRKIVAETRGSEGSAIDHVGFSVPDLAAKLAELKAAGVEVVAEPTRIESAGFSYAFVRDPWGTRIEVLDDPDVQGFHHMHLKSTDPSATVKWYSDRFGGEITTFKGIASLPAIRYGSMWLLVQKGEGVEPSTGHSIDHLGWKFSDYDDALKRLKAGVEFALEPQPAERPTMAYIVGPDGVKIEVVRAEE
jgi:catechol 2,3-dioxygenase-like lactoylglutathione lyase family enzyme